MIDSFESTVINNPLLFPISSEILDLVGDKSIRSAYINKLIFFYEVNISDEHYVVTGLVLIGEK